MTNIQLYLFNDNIDWLCIDNDWLCDYLNRLYPDLKFCYNGFDISQKKHNKLAELHFSVKTTDYKIWDNPILIHLGVQKKYGSLEGVGVAVNNMEDFEIELPKFVEKFYMYVNK